jgi:hypothetical protein
MCIELLERVCQLEVSVFATTIVIKTAKINCGKKKTIVIVAK